MAKQLSNRVEHGEVKHPLAEWTDLCEVCEDEVSLDEEAETWDRWDHMYLPAAFEGNTALYLCDRGHRWITGWAWAPAPNQKQRDAIIAFWAVGQVKT